MELDNQSEAQNETTQPDDVVVTESEITEAKPQAEASEEQEFYVDDSSDDQLKSHKTEMTQAQAYAAFQKKKKQSAARKEELEASKARIKQLEEERDKLKASVVEAPPTYESCGFDEDEFQKKTQEYYKRKVATTNAPAPENVDDATEFYLYQHEQALAKKIPDYEESKKTVIESFSNYGITNTDGAVSYLTNIARKKNIDIAKVFVAMGKIPSILDNIVKAGDNDFAVADILEDAAKKVKPRENKKIDSKPEPEINNSGVIDNTNASVVKAYKNWQKEPTIANHKLYLAAKNKLNK